MKKNKIYEGKAKILYKGPEPGTLIQHFKDDATANNNEKMDVFEGKGVINNRISEHLFTLLSIYRYTSSLYQKAEYERAAH